jgi:Mg2+-importing ATPase
LISSVFDYLTFGVLLLLLHASMDQFRTGWFVESVISASVIVLVIRTRKPFYKSRPGRYLLLATLFIGIVTLLIPLSPVGMVFGFTSLPASFLVVLGAIVASYVLAAEVAKRFFYARVSG